MPMLDDRLDLLRNSSIFKGLEESELVDVLRASKNSHLDNGGFYFMEGEPANKAYVLLAGKVKLIQVTTDGQQVILGYLVPGRVYGIISILKKVTYPVSAQAVGTSSALRWDQGILNHLMEQYPRIALNAMRIMAGQIRTFQNTVRDLSTKRVEQRIARTILRLARQSGRKVETGVLIDLPLSRQDLAEMTGTTLFSVSRILSDWESKSLVQSKRQQVTILYPHGLVQIAEDLPGDTKDEEKTIPEDLCDL
jgi:CRP-like cAMP-binding protein